MTNLLLQTIQGQSMGGIWTLRLPARKVGLNHAAIAGLVQSALDRVEDQMSAWRPA